MNVGFIISKLTGLLIPCFISVQLTYSQGQWSWISGDETKNNQGVYQVKGAHPRNQPGGRNDAVSWIDAAGNLWLFGGSISSGDLNDLWKFNTLTHQWSWISGDNTTNNSGIYETKGPHPKNQPGSRNDAVSWVDTNGNLWMFGGQGYASNQYGFLNDLWQYNPVSNQWSWVGGDNTINRPGVYVTKGFHPNNKPGSRDDAVGWIDATNNLWLFGGEGHASTQGYLNDLWRFNPVSNQWSWVSGDNTTDKPGVYETKGPHLKNQPAGRDEAMGWKDASGNLWLFGGEGFSSTGFGQFNDLWQYDTGNNQWSWIDGDKSINNARSYAAKGPHPNNKPGSRNDGVSWTTSSNALLLFGGQGYSSNESEFLNDLWQFNPANNQWSWMSGDSTDNNPGTYVAKEPHPDNKPGSRDGAVSWMDGAGNLWLFGGLGYASNGYGLLNDLWKFVFCALPTGTINHQSKKLCFGESINLAVTSTGSTAYQWYRNNEPIPGATAVNYLAKETGIYKVRIYTAGGCTALAGDSVVVKVNPSINANAGDIVAATCTSNSGSATITATGGTAPYTYSLDGGNFAAANKFDKLAPGKHSVIVKDSEGCTFTLAIPAINATNPGITYNPIIVTPGAPYPLSARPNVGNSYSWSPADGLDNSKSPTPTVTTNKDVTYHITMIATSGCITVDTQRVLVAKPGTGNNKDSEVAVVPTAFTPNSNAVNDRLKPIPYSIKTLTYFKVFNRWGQLVFETKTVGVGWDGTLKGKPQPTETYNWILECISASGTKIKKSGRSLLIR